MPINTVIVLTALFVLFGGFIVIVGSVSLWVQFADMKTKRVAKSPLLSEMKRRPELAGQI